MVLCHLGECRPKGPQMELHAALMVQTSLEFGEQPVGPVCQCAIEPPQRNQSFVELPLR